MEERNRKKPHLGAACGVGTPGYAAPELSSGDPIGPATDVFGLAAIVFFLLTGEDYFPVRSLAQAIVAMQRPERRRIAEVRTAPGDLRGDVRACDAIDATLAHATHPDGGVGLATGTDVAVVCYAGSKTTCGVVDGQPSLTAAAVDVTGHVWAASAGRIWTRERTTAGGYRWAVAWDNRAWAVAFVSMLAERGTLVAVTADGAIVEGATDTPGARR